MCKSTRNNTIMVAAFFALAALLTIFGLYYYSTQIESNKSGTVSAFNESRAVPTPMIDETEAPLPLQIDDAVAKRLNILGYSTNVAPIKVVGGESNKK